MDIQWKLTNRPFWIDPQRYHVLDFVRLSQRTRNSTSGVELYFPINHRNSPLDDPLDYEKRVTDKPIHRTGKTESREKRVTVEWMVISHWVLTFISFFSCLNHGLRIYIVCGLKNLNQKLKIFFVWRHFRSYDCTSGAYAW